MLKFDKNVKIMDDIEEFWGNLLNMKSAMKEPIYGDLTSFVFNVLCLPHSSAAAEIVFSDLRLIKNYKTNRFSLEMVKFR